MQIMVGRVMLKQPMIRLCPEQPMMMMMRIKEVPIFRRALNSRKFLRGSLKHYVKFHIIVFHIMLFKHCSYYSIYSLWYIKLIHYVISWIRISVIKDLTSRDFTMLKKDAMKVIVTQTWRKGTRLMAKMVMVKQSMIDMKMTMKQNQQMVVGQNKVAARD